MDSVHHIWCPLSSQEYQDLPDGAETTLTYKLTMNGKELVEIDVLNMIEKVNGVDRLDQHRRNIGL
ncbi:phage major tail tube protein [Klebsiella quasipneumoniae]|nr:phage major tail tube protein [Klebsiella quasipneumoniae]